MPSSLEQRNALIVEHVPLAHKIAKAIGRKLPAWFDRESLFGPAMIGLVEAAQEYEADKGISFPGFAHLRIRGAIVDHLREQDIASRSLRLWQKELRRQENFFLLLWQKPALAEDLAKMMHISWEKYCELYHHITTAQNISFENVFAQVSEESEEGESNRWTTAALSYLKQNQDKSPQEKSIDRQNFAILARAMSYLNEKQRIVLELHYHYELPETSTAEIMGISQPMVNRIRKQAEKVVLKHCQSKVPLAPKDYKLSVFDSSKRPEYDRALAYKPRQHLGC